MIKNNIGFYAGDIYSLLSQRGKMTIRKIGELTHQQESSIFLSIGWLLRENKLSVTENDGEWFFEITANLSEIYY